MHTNSSSQCKTRSLASISYLPSTHIPLPALESLRMSSLFSSLSPFERLISWLIVDPVNMNRHSDVQRWGFRSRFPFSALASLSFFVYCCLQPPVAMILTQDVSVVASRQRAAWSSLWRADHGNLFQLFLGGKKAADQIRTCSLLVARIGKVKKDSFNLSWLSS